MAEPTVQVPLSLIESWERRFRNVADMPGTADELRAMLLQLTPTTASPSIDDMVPGTTFTAAIKGDTPERWGRCNNGKIVRLTRGGTMWDWNHIDPSTIRDVTPPEVTS